MDEAEEEEYCQALYSFEPADHNELALEVGEVIKILSKDDFTWWKGESLDGRRGYFPVDYVQPISYVEVWNDGTASQYKESKPNHVGTNGKSRAQEIHEGVQMEPIPEEFEKPEAPAQRTPQPQTKPKVISNVFILLCLKFRITLSLIRIPRLRQKILCYFRQKERTRNQHLLLWILDDGLIHGDDD